MSDPVVECTKRRKRIERMKKLLLLTAVILLLASVVLNIVLLVQVIHLNQLVDQLYGMATYISV